MEFGDVVYVVCRIGGSDVFPVGLGCGEEEEVDCMEGYVGVKDDDYWVIIWGCVEGNCCRMYFTHVVDRVHCSHLWWKYVSSELQWNRDMLAEGACGSLLLQGR